MCHHRFRLPCSRQKKKEEQKEEAKSGHTCKSACKQHDGAARSGHYLLEAIKMDAEIQTITASETRAP